MKPTSKKINQTIASIEKEQSLLSSQSLAIGKEDASGLGNILANWKQAMEGC